ncbi:MAG: LUD domain-containing protein [bacterium]
MSSRELILNRIKDASKFPSEIPSVGFDFENEIKKEIAAITPKDNPGLWLQFQKELEAISGEFYSFFSMDEAAEIISKLLLELKIEKIGISKENICNDVAIKLKEKIASLEIVSPVELNAEERKKEFAATEAAIVHPAFAVADIGSLVFNYDTTGTSYPHFLCDNTFVIINENQIIANQFELFDKIDVEESKNMVFVTGPSRTADIEKVLVLGAHGPRRLLVIKIKNQIERGSL